MSKLTYFGSVFAVLLLAILLLIASGLSPAQAERGAGGRVLTQAHLAPLASGGYPTKRDNPFSDQWLAANHGKFDNIWTAEYEARQQRATDPSSGSDPFPHLFQPLLSDVRMSNPSFNTEQNEFQIDINPTNSQYAIGTSNDSLTAGVGIYRTSDGGATWTAFDAPIGTSSCCDPGVAYAYDGNAYVIDLDTSPFVTYIIRTTDNGVTWSTPTNVQTNDRPNIVVDNGVDSPRRGTVYLTYTDENASNRVKGYKSTDQGLTWSTTFFVGDVISPTGFEQGSQPRVASDGTLYVGYQQYNDINAGCAAGVQDTVAKSTDGGASFTYSVMPMLQGGVCTSTQNGRGLFCYTSGGSAFRSRSSPILGINPTNPQHVYMIYSGGDLEIPYTCGTLTGYHSDILYRISTDGGASFTAPTKINTDPPGSDQYYPWMNVTPNGTIWVGWHDRREDPNDFRHRWYDSYSTDEGATWHKLDGSLGNEPVAGVTSLPFNFIGDYAGQGATDDLVLPMWWDSRIKTTGDPYTAVGVVVMTPTPGPTDTPAPTDTATPTNTFTAVSTATNTSTPSSTICPIQFTDVAEGSTFYPYIRCLACRGIVNGYTTTPPCTTGTPCFLPGNNVTRGQMAKFVSNSANYQDPIPPTQQTFTDVAPNSTFWLYIERAYLHGVIQGYTTSPPCTTGTPCFLPGNNVTRGQTAKFVSIGANYQDPIPPTQQTFTDVAPNSTFWLYIERVFLHGVVSGYSTSPPCTTGTPCFLSANNVSRGQTAKFISNAFFPNCNTPAR